MAPSRGLFDRIMGGTTAGGPAPAAPAAAGSSGGVDRPLTGPGRPWAGNDPIVRLSEPKAKKLRGWREEQEDLSGSIQTLAEQRRRAVEIKVDRDRYLGQLQASHRGGSGGGARPVSSISPYMRGDYPAGGIEHRFPEQHATRSQIEEAEAELAEAREALDALDRRIAEKQAMQSRLPGLLTEWLRAIPTDVKFEEFESDRKAAKGSATVADIEKARQRIAQLRAEIHTIRSAPPPSATVKARMRAQVAALAERARPNYLGAVESGQPIKFPELQVQMQTATAAGIGISLQTMPDMLGLFCYVHGDALIRKMEADIDELADDEGSLSDEEKAQRERQILAGILEIERVEEAAIEQLEVSGVPIARRDDADPRAVLGLSGDLPAPASMF